MTSITNSNDNYSHPTTLPLSIRNSSAVDDIVVQTNPHTTSDTAVLQAPGDVVLNIPSMVSDRADSNGLTAVGCQTPTVPPLEGIDGVVVEVNISQKEDAPEGSQYQPRRIPIATKLDPKLYNAAVKGDVKLLDEFLQSQDLQNLDGTSPHEVTIGDNTILHISATSSGDLTSLRKGDYVGFAKAVYFRNRSLLMARNRLKETPLHCAVKAGNIDMVSCLISFATEEGQSVKQSLLTARNKHGETTLHEAVRVGHEEMVKKLIESEPSLTGIVDAKGVSVSPLYLATMMNALNIVEIFTREDPSVVSFAGPNGQTALHAAVLLQHTGITCTLLEWNNSLATKVDDSESTPLHYAASGGNLDTVKLLLQHETSAAYMADKDGLFPIHVAARCGRALIIKELIKQFPDSDELLDKEGRNFLHLAVLRGKENTSYSIRYNPTFLRMLNAKDKDGNTPLHLAGKNGQYGFVRFLTSMKTVDSNIMNRDGSTPLDLAVKEVDRRLVYIWATKLDILHCIMWTGGLPSPLRFDHLRDDLKITLSDKEREKLKSIIRSLGIISVLIATVTFAASFTLPGGYIADDHANKGTPILSRKYFFKAFIVADVLAFFLSILAESWIVYVGSPNVDIRPTLLGFSFILVDIAVRATVCAFILALYTMLYQVNFPISILGCVATFGIMPFCDPKCWGVLLLAQPIVKRVGWKGLFKSPFLAYVLLFMGPNFILYGVIFLLALL